MSEVTEKDVSTESPELPESPLEKYFGDSIRRKEKIRDLFGIDVSEKATVITKPAKPYDKNYHFNKLVVKKLLNWALPNSTNRNLFIPGDGGTGKTSLIVEFASRLGIECYAKSCSGRTYASDLIGSLQIDKNGKTYFTDGPLTKAYRYGGIFIANEVTRMDSGELMQLVDVLDERAQLVINQTGEVVPRHPDFRFAATGNSIGFGDEVGAYAGEKRISTAFLDRFRKLKIPALTEAEEIEICHRYAPDLDIDVITNMVGLARATRQNFIGEGGSMRVCIQTRALVDWAKLSQEYGKFGDVNPLEEALHDTILITAPKEEAEAIKNLYSQWIAA